MGVPLVSVIIPAYNAARTLEATVKSVLAQTMQDFEIIIVDDGSKDDSLSVARSFSDSRIQVIAQPNGGAAAARNSGIKAATGEYVALLDADDLWLPRKLEIQLAALEEHPEVQAVQSGAYFVNNQLAVLSVHPCTNTGNSFVETLRFQNLPAFLSALMVRRQSLIEVGMFDAELEILEEWDMAIKMSRYCGMRSVVEPLVLYRVHPGNRHRNVDIHIKPGLTVLQRLYADTSLPVNIFLMRQEVYGTFYRTLAGGYFNNKQYRQFIKWALRTLNTDPCQINYMIQLPWRKWQRYRSRRVEGRDIDIATLLSL